MDIQHFDQARDDERNAQRALILALAYPLGLLLLVLALFVWGSA
jgi:hypothetical protein